jgi:uncharacterized protein YjbJ (UPF0337 family)
MENDKVQGKAKQAEGKVKEVAGVAADNRELEAKGKAKQVEGKGQETVGKAKDALTDDEKDQQNQK